MVKFFLFTFNRCIVTIGFGIFLSGCIIKDPPEKIIYDQNVNQNSNYFGYCSFMGDLKNTSYNEQEYTNCHQYKASRAMTCCSVNHGAWFETN